MYRILNNSKNGMVASQDKLNIVGQNIVNSQTNGYKKLDINFSDLIPETLNRGYIPTNKEVQTGTGVRSTNPIRVHTQGTLNNTGRVTDLAIQGEGMFSVTTPNGDIKYTRNGDFNIDSSGKIVDLNGNILNIEFNGGNNYENVGITVDNLSINKKGEVLVDGNMVGKIGVYTTDGDNEFISEGDNLFKLRELGEIVPSTEYTIMQGYIEMSNVDMIAELTDMMAMQKALQFNARGIQMANDMWGLVNNMRAK